MANPNIVNVSQIYGNNDFAALTTTEVAIINNPASSGKVVKVNSIIASCVNTTGTAQVSLNVYSQDDLGGTSYAIAADVIIPNSASLILVDGLSSIYLTEDQSIGAVSSGNNEAEIIASWEEIN